MESEHRKQSIIEELEEESNEREMRCQTLQETIDHKTKMLNDILLEYQHLVKENDDFHHSIDFEMCQLKLMLQKC